MEKCTELNVILCRIQNRPCESSTNQKMHTKAFPKVNLQTNFGSVRPMHMCARVGKHHSKFGRSIIMCKVLIFY